jgi:ubiquinone/menaquinone biosynthesis C-methylase UbiE
MSSEGHQNRQNTYVMDPESAAEMGRLLLQDRLINQAMGGYFPEQSDLQAFQQVLDIGCGPGGWALGAAKQHSHLTITGIDISELMITYAQAQALRENIKNASFEVMDALAPLEFPDNSFDIVNIRTAIGWLPRASWPEVLRECHRVARPGGIIRLTECDSGGSNGAATAQWARHLAHLLYLRKLGFSPDEFTVGITAMLGKLLLDAECASSLEQISHRVFMIDCSYGAPLHAIYFQNSLGMYKQLQPAFVKMGFAKQEELNRLYSDFQAEVQDPGYCATMYWLTRWVKKTRTE